MPSTFTTSGIELIASGEQSGVWGDTTNVNLQIIDRLTSRAGTITLSGTTHTLTTSNGTLSDGHFNVLVFAGSPSGTNTVTISPNTIQRVYLVRNTTAQTVVLTQGSGGNVSLAAGLSKIVYVNGGGASAAVFDITNTLSGTFTGNLTGNVTGALTGNASTATALQTARTIGGVSFNGTANINLPGVNIGGNQNTTGSAATLTTARTLTIGSTGKTFNGSANVAWSLAEIGVNNATLTLATSGIATGSQTFTSNQGTAATFTVNVPATNLTYSTAASTGTVNSSTGTNATIPAATTSLAGLLTGADKTKLDGIAAGAQVNVATNLTYTTATTTGTVNSSTGTNATIPAATTSLAGLMTNADKTKLDGIAAGAQVNVATNLGYTTAASTGTVTSSTGTDATLPAATTTLAGLMTGADKEKLDGISPGASGTGTVTSVAASGGTGISVTGSPITTSGTLTITNTAPHIATNLGYTTAASTGTVTSSTGTNATLPAATTSLAGLLTGADKTKLDGIAAGAQVNVATNLSVTAGTTAGPTINSSTGTNVVIPSASATASGVVTTNAQTFAGVKTFSSTITGSVSGNAGTATALQNARTIGGVSFNGTANIDLPGVNTGGNQNTTGSAATLTTARNINGTSFNGSANITTANWGTARTIWGQSINGSANITAPVLPAAGSAAAPAFSTSGDTNTGIFFPAADTLAFTEGGVEVMRITSAGDVGIGTTTPAAKLDVGGTGAIKVPVGTEAQRPTPATGQFRFNSDVGKFEGYNGTAWGAVGGGGGFFKGENGAVGDATTGPGDIFRINEQALNTNVTIDSAENASCTGPLTVASGVTLTVNGNLAVI